MKTLAPESKSASRDETSQKLKSEIQLIVSSSKNYAYRSPDQVFQQRLMQEYLFKPDAPKIIEQVVRDLKRQNPSQFSKGKDEKFNYELFVKVKDDIDVLVEEAEQLRLAEEERQRELQAQLKAEEEKRKKAAKKPPNGRRATKSPPKKPEDPLGRYEITKPRETFTSKEAGHNYPGVSGASSFNGLDLETALKDYKAKAQEMRYTFGVSEKEGKPKEPPKPLGERKPPASNTTKSQTKLVRELVRRGQSNDNTGINRSDWTEGSLSHRNNKPLVALQNSRTAAKQSKADEKKPNEVSNKEKHVDDFFKRNYGI